jgi:hypothetical protein
VNCFRFRGRGWSKFREGIRAKSASGVGQELGSRIEISRGDQGKISKPKWSNSRGCCGARNWGSAEVQIWESLAIGDKYLNIQTKFGSPGEHVAVPVEAVDGFLSHS